MDFEGQELDEDEEMGQLEEDESVADEDECGQLDDETAVVE
jgi:hypothetical protein